MELKVSREQLRGALAEMLADPETRRVIAQSVLGSVSVRGGLPETSARDVSSGEFGADCSPPGGDYSFPAKLGIGVTNPGAPLHVRKDQNAETDLILGNFNTSVLGNPNAGLVFSAYRDVDPNHPVAKIVAIPSYDPGSNQGTPATYADLAFHTTSAWSNLSEKMRITKDGKVGIGTTGPETPLMVVRANSGSGALTPVLKVQTDGSSGEGPMVKFAATLAQNVAKGFIAYQSTGGGYGGNGKLLLGVNPATDTTDVSASDAKVAIQGDGKVGIGTTAPAEKLDVAGNLRVSGASAFGPGTAVHNSQATGYVVVFVDSTYTDTQQEVRGVGSIIYSAYVNTLDETIDGWDRFGLEASAEIIETNKEYIRGQQKGVVAELYTYTPSAIDAWQPNHSYAFQKLVRPTVANGRYYRVITPGTSGSTEPDWPPSEGETEPDGTLVWQETPLVETMLGLQSFIGVALGTSVGKWYGLVVAPPGPNKYNDPPHEADPGTIRTGYGVFIQNLGEDSTILASGNAAAIKIDGLGNYGRILWTSCSVYCSSSGVLEFNATTANFSGVVNSATGFRIGGAAAPSGYYLRGNGSNFVDSAIQAADIPNLDASKITTGQFGSSQIPNLDAGKITSGQFEDARMPDSVVMMKDGSTKKVACGIELVSTASGGTPGSVTINTGLSSISAVAITHVWSTSANAAGTVSSVSGGSFHLNNELSSAEYFYWIAIGT